jgi:DNA-binding NarL/FixJ family response regulator
MGNSNRIRVLIVDDHELVRFGLQTAMAGVEDIEVCGLAADGESAVHRAQSMRPDVVLMDIGLPRIDGIEASNRIKQKLPHIKILILTSYEREQDVLAAFAAGADGYCLKTISPEGLAGAIRAVNNGAAWLDPAVADTVLRGHPTPGKSGNTQPRRMSLSQREYEVLALVVEGLSNTAIAERLRLSPQTIKTHVRHIMEKLAVSDRTQAAVKALREGLFDT